MKRVRPKKERKKHNAHYTHTHTHTPTTPKKANEMRKKSKIAGWTKHKPENLVDFDRNEIFFGHLKCNQLMLRSSDFSRSWGISFYIWTDVGTKEKKHSAINCMIVKMQQNKTKPNQKPKIYTTTKKRQKNTRKKIILR